MSTIFTKIFKLFSTNISAAIFREILFDLRRLLHAIGDEREQAFFVLGLAAEIALGMSCPAHLEDTMLGGTGAAVLLGHCDGNEFVGVAMDEHYWNIGFCEYLASVGSLYVVACEFFCAAADFRHYNPRRHMRDCPVQIAKLLVNRREAAVGDYAGDFVAADVLRGHHCRRRAHRYAVKERRFHGVRGFERVYPHGNVEAVEHAVAYYVALAFAVLARHDVAELAQVRSVAAFGIEK